MVSISKCDIIDIIQDTQRFVFHIFTVNLFMSLIDNKLNEIFSRKIINTLIVTVLAVILYNITVKKLIQTKLNNLKKDCENNE
jgi:hypothetical protein